MQGNQLFEYAVIRIVPRVERGEFLNVGVILYCPGFKFLKAKYHINKERVTHFCDQLDLADLEVHLKTFEKISDGEKSAGPIARLPIAERFRWLTATRSTIVQSSKVHPGFCKDPEKTLEKLFEQLVL